MEEDSGLHGVLIARNVGFDNIKVISKDRIANVPVSAVYPATDETGKLSPQGKLYADKFIQEQESQGEEGLEYDSPSVIKAAEEAMNADKFVVGGKSPTLGMVTFTNAANAGKRNAEQMGLMPKRSQTRNKQINPDSVSFQNSLDAVERVLCQFVDPTGQADVAPTNAMLAQLIRIGDKIDETIGRYGEQAFDTLPDSE